MPVALPSVDVVFIVYCTGRLWSVWQTGRAGTNLVKISHDSLPAFGVDVCLKVIAGLGHKVFSVYIVE